MSNYFVRKLFSLVTTLFLVSTITFFLMHSIPGDPFLQDKAIPEEILAAMNHHYGLDQPLYIQYWKFIQGALHGDLGPSFRYEGRQVTEIISEGFPISLTLGLEALAVAIPFGIALGSWAAWKRGKWADHLAIIVAIIWISVPSFILATFLQYLLAMKLKLFPIARWGTFLHTVLPVLSLAALPTAVIARLTRSNTIEVLTQDYLLTAKSKGLSSFVIFRRHLLRNSLLPVISYLGPMSAAIFTGSFAVEKIFGIPGMGQWFVTSITNRDYTMIMGMTLFYCAFLLGTVFIADLLYRLVDPRISHAKQ